MRSIARALSLMCSIARAPLKVEQHGLRWTMRFSLWRIDRRA
jgi:hypothetical protein